MSIFFVCFFVVQLISTSVTAQQNKIFAIRSALQRFEAAITHTVAVHKSLQQVRLNLLMYSLTQLVGRIDIY
jgi:hypothetical protein